VAATRPGSKATIQVWRKGAAREIPITVGELSDERKVAEKPRKHGSKGGEAATRLGMSFVELTAEQRKEFDVGHGVLVDEVQPQSNAARAGIRRGDILLAINNNDVNSVEQLNRMIGQFEKSRSVALLIRRGDSNLYVPLRLGAN
jgi:serine protease Do